MQREAERARAVRERDAARRARDAQRSQAARARERVADQKERARQYALSRAEEVAEDNGELDAEVAALDAVLASTLDVDDFLDLETLKQPVVLPQFDPSVAGAVRPAPRLEEFLPDAPSGLGRAFGGAARHQDRVQQAHAAFERAAAAHQVQAQAHGREFEAARRRHDAEVARLTDEHREQIEQVTQLQRGLAAGLPEAVVGYLDLVLEAAIYPEGFPHAWRLAYTPETRQLVVEYELPAREVVPAAKAYRYVKSSDTVTPVARSQAQIRALYTSVVAQTSLRVVHEVLESDRAGRVASVVLNAHVTATDPGTGRSVRPCLVALGTTRSRFRELDLRQVDPAACLRHLEARVSRDPAGLVPVEPMVRFDTIDLRFSSETEQIGPSAPPPRAPGSNERRGPTPAPGRPESPRSSAEQDLTAGQNVVLTGPVIDISLPEAWTSPADLSVLILGPDGRVAGDDDFIFFNNPTAADGAIGLRGGDNPDGATIDLSLLPEHCERLVVVASGADSTVDVARTALLVLDPAAETSQLTFRPADTTKMPALICAEIYRRQGSWRLRAVGQGYGDGLAGLARDYGVNVN
ncbi:TerD family protein [Pseudonocardia sp.]|uniref:TerD family protein n=1 Tax=Pseudonocardia sp. TaxID=60912 RepID=UPI002614F7AD|nr:TerD family protein [Pseudonocardia sp.]